MKIKIVFNDDHSAVDVDYRLIDNSIAKKWYKKLKHIYRLPVSKSETRNEYDLDISKHHKIFCEKIGLDFKELDYNKQEDLNYLHWLYESQFSNVVNNTKNTDFLYLFHHSIHNKESMNKNDIGTNFNIGWGELEGPLTQKQNLNSFYSENIKKNNLYLMWSELGKKPFRYFLDHEPHNQERFNELAKPHQHFRVQFSLRCVESKNEKFSEPFKKWFKNYKDSWLQAYGLKDWTERDEFSGVHLAEPITNISEPEQFLKMKLKKIELYD